MESFRKSLIVFFNAADKALTVVDNLLQSSKKPVNSCRSLGKILRAIVRDRELKATKLAQLPNVHAALIDNVSREIGVEIVLLNQIRDDIFTTTKDLEKRWLALNKSYSSFLTSDPAATSYEPAIQGAEDCWRFCYSIYLEVSQILALLDPDNEESLSKLSKLLSISFIDARRIILVHKLQLEID